MIIRQSLTFTKFIPHLLTKTPLLFNISNQHNTAQKLSEQSFQEFTINPNMSKSVGTNRFILKVYNTTALSILAALSTSYALLLMPFSAQTIYFLARAGLITTLVGFIGTAVTSPEYTHRIQKIDQKNRIQTIVAKNTMMRYLLYGMGIFGLGLSVTPMLGLIHAVNPLALPLALGLSTVVFGGASLAAYKFPKQSVISYGRVLAGSLIGLGSLQLISLGSVYILGPNMFQMMLSSPTSYAAGGLFTGLVAYDTYRAIKMYEQDMPDNLGIAGNFLLDLWNILISFLRMLMGKAK